MLVLFCLLATIALGKDSRYNTENIPKLTIEDIESIEDEEALFSEQQAYMLYVEFGKRAKKKQKNMINIKSR